MLREDSLAAWGGGAESLADHGRFASVRTLGQHAALVLRDPQMTTVVPLELGGVLLVSATYCDGDAAVMSHLEMMPVTGWEILEERFRSQGGDYVLFDGTLSGAELSDPALARRVLERHGGALRIGLLPGSYEVETLGPWNPDARTELWLTRLVRCLE